MRFWPLFFFLLHQHNIITTLFSFRSGVSNANQTRHTGTWKSESRKQEVVENRCYQDWIKHLHAGKSSHVGRNDETRRNGELLCFDLALSVLQLVCSGGSLWVFQCSYALSDPKSISNYTCTYTHTHTSQIKHVCRKRLKMPVSNEDLIVQGHDWLYKYTATLVMCVCVFGCVFTRHADTQKHSFRHPIKRFSWEVKTRGAYNRVRAKYVSI